MSDDEGAIGDILDAQGVRLTLEGDDLITGAVVLAKVVDGEGRERMAMGWTEGQSWLERVGMLRIAELIEREDIQNGAPRD